MSSFYDSIKASVQENGEDSRVEVNQRALIDKILARYASANSVYRELLQNSNDADATEAHVHFHVDPDSKNVTQVLYKNNGIPFRDQDWSRLKKIAEGNPDVSKVGAFGVGAYTMFSICEEPIVLSGSQALAFFWKGDALWTKVGPSSHVNNEWTAFVLPSRDPYPLPDLVDFGEFLCASLTFTQQLSTIRVYVNETERLCIRKTVTELARAIQPPKASSWFSNDGAVTSSSRGIFSLKNQSAIFETVHKFTVTIDGHVASNEARYVSAEAKTKIPSDMARRMERVTKKQPPPSVKVEAFLNHQLHENPSKNNAERIVRSFVPQQGSGRIFIGFRTSQTTGLAAHVAAPFIPTVEREAIDLQDATLRVFNGELIEFAGILLRLTLDHAFGVLDEEWQRTAHEREALEKRLEQDSKNTLEMVTQPTFNAPEENDETDSKSSLMKFARFMARGVKKKIKSASQYVEELMDTNNGLLYPPDPRPLSIEEKRAILLMQSFCPQLSTPDTSVGTHLAEGFGRCMPNMDPPVLTRSGVVSGKHARLPYLGIEGFVTSNVVRPVVLANAEEYFALITNTPKLSIQDLKQFLTNNVLDELSASRLLRWWTKFARADRRTNASHGISLKNSTRFTLDSETQIAKVHHMRDFLFYISALSPFYDPALPMPETVLPRHFQTLATVEVLEDSSLSDWFEPLPVELWVEFIGHQKCMHDGLADDENLRLSCLSVLNKEYLRNTQENRNTFGNYCKHVLAEKRCIPFDSEVPSTYSADQPGKLYLRSADLHAFRGIGNMHKVSQSLRSIDVHEDFLLAIGVRKSVAIDLLFEHLDTLQWNDDPKALVEYLQSATLTAEDIAKLTRTKYLPALGDSSATYAPAELYLPSEDLGLFPFVKILSWPSDSELRQSSASGKFLVKLGMKTIPPIKDVLAFAADKSVPTSTRLRVLDYMAERLGPHGCYHGDYSKLPFRLRKSFAFLPCYVRVPLEESEVSRDLFSPVDCFGDESCACMGFPVIDPDTGETSKLYASLFQCAPEPSAAVLLDQLSLLVEKAMVKYNSSSPGEMCTVAANVEDYFTSVFKYMSQRSSDFTKAELQELRTKDFIPVRNCENLQWMRSDQVFFKEAEVDVNDGLTGNLFPRIAFSPFLAAAGVKQEATAHDIFERLLSDAKGVYAMLGSEKKYRALLRRIAANRPFTTVSSRIRNAPFLIAYSLNHNNEKDDAVAFHLLKAEDIFIIDNTYFGRMFPVPRAPPETDLEDFYVLLGSPYISKSVEKRYEVVGRPRAQTSVTTSLKERIKERSPLLVSPGVSSRALVSDAIQRIHEDRLDFLEADNLIAVYTLRGTSKRSKTTCFPRQTTRSDRVLFVIHDFDWFDVGYALGEIILQRCQLEDAFLISSLLETPLDQLRSRGFPVDRVLRLQQDAIPAALGNDTNSSIETLSRERPISSTKTPVLSSSTQGSSSSASSSDGPDAILKQMFPDADEGYIEDALGPQPSLEAVRQLAEQMTQGGYPTKATSLQPKHEDSSAISPPKRPNRLRNKLGKALSGFKIGPPAPDIMRPTATVNGNTTSQSTKVHNKPVSPAIDTHSLQNLEQLLQQTAGTTRKANKNGIHSDDIVLTSIPDTLDRGDTCEVIPGQSLEPHPGPRGDGFSYNGIQIFAQRGESISRHFLDVNHEAIELFSLVLERLAGVFGIKHEDFAIFYNPFGGTIAFNSNRSLHFNLRFFHSLHYLSGKQDSADCYSYWYITMAHEMAHHLVSAHNKEHGFYTESYATLYLPKLIALISSLS